MFNLRNFSKKKIRPELIRLIKKLRNRWKSFILFISKNKILRLKFSLLLFIFLFFPTLNKSWYQSFEKKPSILNQLDAKIIYPDKVLSTRNTPLPYYSAGGVYIYDIRSQSLLYEKNSSEIFYPASTTKIITALVALDIYSPDNIITVPQYYSIGQTIGLVQGEQYRFKDLLYGLLVQSGNDVGDVLALSYTDGYDEFIKKMNQKAFELGAEESKFANPTGIDQYQHYVSPRDLAVMSLYAQNNLLFAEAVKTKNTLIADITGSHIIELENVNQLLGVVEGMEGVKTGWTELAGECLVSYTMKQDLTILAVILNSRDRFGDTARLISWAEDNFYPSTD